MRAEGDPKVARIVKEIEVQGRPAVALFDTSALYSYVRSSFAKDAPRLKVPVSVRVILGGKTIEIQEVCFITGKIEGLDFFTDIVPVDELGTADGQELDVLIGARTMEQWEIKLDPRTGELDLEGLRRRDFTEFWEDLCHSGLRG